MSAKTRAKKIAARGGHATFDGDPCPQHPGHTTRYSATDQCTACNRDKARAYKQTAKGKAANRAYQRRRTAKVLRRPTHSIEGICPEHGPGPHRPTTGECERCARRRSNRAYYAKTKAKRADAYQDQRNTLLPTLRASNTRYRQSDTGQVVRRAANQRRRARQAGALVVDIRPDIPERCPHCQEPMIPWTTHVDHVIPLSRGGPHTPDNVRVICAQCNLTKHTKTAEEFDRLKLYPRVEHPARIVEIFVGVQRKITAIRASAMLVSRCAATKLVDVKGT